VERGGKGRVSEKGEGEKGEKVCEKKKERRVKERSECVSKKKV
jgi:hypothetical protein